MADNLTTFMLRLSSNLEASTSWKPQGLYRPVQGLLYLYPSYRTLCGPQTWPGILDKRKTSYLYGDKNPGPPSTQLSLRMTGEQKQFWCAYFTYPLNLGFQRNGAEFDPWHSYVSLRNGIFPLPRLFFPPPRAFLDFLPSRPIFIRIPFTMRWNQHHPYTLHAHKFVRHSSYKRRGNSAFIEQAST